MRFIEIMTNVNLMEKSSETPLAYRKETVGRKLGRKAEIMGKTKSSGPYLFHESIKAKMDEVAGVADDSGKEPHWPALTQGWWKVSKKMRSQCL